MPQSFARTTAPLLAAASIGLSPLPALALSIGFEEPAPQTSGTQVAIPEYLEAGFRFRDPASDPEEPAFSLARTRTETGGFPSNGSSFLQVLSGASLLIETIDGSAFDLFAMDIAEYSSVYRTPLELVVEGDRADGTTVTATFTTDGQIDGSGPLADFETFVLPDTFRDLLQVRLPVDLFSIDNVVVSVPESRVLWNVAAGLLALAGVARRRRGRSAASA